MEMISGTYNDSVDVFFFFQKLAEIVVRGAAVILAGALLGGIEAVDDFLRGFAPAHSAGHLHGVCELNGLVGTQPIPAPVDTQELANRVAELMIAPLRVSGGAFVNVADGYALHIGLAQETKHHPRSLGANSDESQIDFVTRRNVAGSSQYMAGNNAERGGHCRGLCQEIPP